MKAIRFIPLIGILAMAEAHPDPRHTLAEIDHHLTASPDDPELLLRKAELLYENRLFKYARAVTNKALRIDPDSTGFLLLSARLFEATGDLPGALRQAEETARRFPSHRATHGFIARLYRQSGRTDDAITEKLIQIDGDGTDDTGDSLTAAAWLRDRNQPNDRERAILILDQAISRFGPLTGLQQSVIDLECSIGRHDDALRRIDAMVAKSGPSVAHSLLRAKIHEDTFRFDQAAAACDSAIALLDLDPATDPAVRQNVAERKQANLIKAADR